MFRCLQQYVRCINYNNYHLNLMKKNFSPYFCSKSFSHSKKIPIILMEIIRWKHAFNLNLLKWNGRQKLRKWVFELEVVNLYETRGKSQKFWKKWFIFHFKWDLMTTTSHCKMLKAVRLFVLLDTFPTTSKEYSMTKT